MLNYFNFKQFNNTHYLLTNDFGFYAFLTKQELYTLLRNPSSDNDNIDASLINNGFVLSDSHEMASRDFKHNYLSSKSYLAGSTALHIFVLTLDCNFSCVYCQALASHKKNACIMNTETAAAAVNIALSSPSHNLSFEFQGGEPLLNFNAIKYIVEYTNKHKGNKNVSFSVVTNLTLITNEQLEFFKDNNINIAISIDGPDAVHDMNRPFSSGKGSHETVTYNIQKVRSYGINCGAIQTTTRYSLPFASEIVDEYISLGFNSIFIRPLTPLGMAKATWDQIGYSPEEYINFYKTGLQYILEKNKEGTYFQEGFATNVLLQAFCGQHQNHMEYRSPCGAAIGQLAYNYDGDVFSCDEGRMLAQRNDYSFKLGNVYNDTYSSLIEKPICSTICKASVLESLPDCCDCVYQPYCGVCPVINWDKEKGVVSHIHNNYRCRIQKGMMDAIFEHLFKNDPEEIAIFYRWIENGL